jgi:hypothetical protein
MTDCNHSNFKYEVKATADSLVGYKICTDCFEVIKEVTVERNISDLLDTQAAQEVLDLLKAD